jgi:NTE family protein
MGAVIAAMLAGGLEPEEVFARLRVIRRHDVVRLRAAGLVQGLFASSLLHPEPLKQTIVRLVEQNRFEDFAIPLTVTAADLDTGDLVCFGAGGEPAPVHEALYAACALPLWYPAAHLNGRRLADGGVRSVLPLQVAARFPADLVIALDAGPGTDSAPSTGRLAPPPLVQSYGDAMHSLMASNTELELALWRATPGRPHLIYVRPPTRRETTFAISELASFEAAGYEATRRLL